MRLFDLTPAWKPVAIRERVNRETDGWRWFLPAAEADLLRSSPAIYATAQRREVDGAFVLLARRVA